MSEEKPDQQTVVEQPAWTRLRSAREAKKLQQSDIANELKLDLRLVKALEEGNFEELPKPVYTAGYIRSYSKRVGLPADEIVAEYLSADTAPKGVCANDESPIVPRQNTTISSVIPQRIALTMPHSGDNKQLYHYIMIGVGLVLALLLGWHAASLYRASNQQQPVNLAPESAQGAAMDSDNAQNTTDKADSPRDMTADKGAGQSGESKIGKPSPGTVATGEQKKQITVPLILKGQNVNPADPNGGQSQDLPPGAKIAELSLSFTADSWVDVRDATGKPLIRSLGLAGATKTVSGMAPFEILLGYGPGVSIEYNGEPYDFSKHQGDRVARFTLNPPPSEPVQGE